MTSERVAFVHIWLPMAAQSVLCGRLEQRADGRLDWVYARSYRMLDTAIALDPQELPLTPGRALPPLGDLHGVIRDAAPDAWGRRVMQHTTLQPLVELDFLVGADVDRVGALVVTSSRQPPARVDMETSLDDLTAAAATIESGGTLPPRLAMAMVRGTSVGGARPKALVRDGKTAYVAKFSTFWKQNVFKDIPL